ncbi:cold shock domain-containing protein [Halosolutus halophilus]|uniref:cold shock domain-containing protein n=1 Tax=Halosolutus halophilus TaxID=1552990 RepID=UPI002234FDF5|nr:cold shock domain-containing protein [Halosolutus halophilus]
MGFYLEDDHLVSDTTETEYRVEGKFRRVLETLPDESVPRALILFGLLTEQLAPVESDSEKYIRIASENVDRAPAAEIPVETVKGTMWLLSEVRDSLDTERKRTIGRLLTEAQLNSPGLISTSNASSETEDSTDAAPSPETAPTASSKTPPSGTDTTAEDEITNNDEPAAESTTSNDSDDGERLDCEFCAASFRSESDLMSHSIQCDKRPSDARFQCEHCKNEYISERALSRHLEDCGEIGTTVIYDCETCGEQFESPQRLIKHKHTHSRSNSASRARTTSRTRSCSNTELIERGATGFVVYFDADGGYGFIDSSAVLKHQNTDSDASEDVFFHINEYPGSKVQENEKLRFDIKKTDRRFKAVNISFAQRERIETRDDTFASTRPRWGTDT